MEIVLTQAQVSIVDHPQLPGGKILQFLTPQGIVVTIPLDENAAKKIAAGLTSRLIIANGSLVPSDLQQ